MTIDRPISSPPRWAESLLLLLLEPKDRESFSGDLLEEYRETVVPARGRGANRWYIGQVAWFLWRASWMWGAAIGSALIVRYLFDTLAPVTNFVERSAILTQAIVTIFGAAAFWNTWRTDHIRTGMHGRACRRDHRRRIEQCWYRRVARHLARSGDAAGVAEQRWPRRGVRRRADPADSDQSGLWHRGGSGREGSVDADLARWRSMVGAMTRSVSRGRIRTVRVRPPPRCIACPRQDTTSALSEPGRRSETARAACRWSRRARRSCLRSSR